MHGRIFARALAMAAFGAALLFAAGAPKAEAAAGPIPTGQWHCFSGVGWDAAKNQPGIGGLASPQFEGYMWIYDAHHYANMKPNDRGTYTLVGNELVAHSGPWVRADAVLHYKKDGYFHRPTIFFGYKDVPSIHFACNPGR